MDSIDYYERYAASYYENTVNLNMEEALGRFLALLPENAEVLDLGCGTGRDTVYLEDAGCYVTPMDGSEQMCRLAEIYTDKEVLHMTFEEMEFEEVFDGIWACASLLHVEGKNMDRIMKKVVNALKPDGVLYMSFKYGDAEEIRNQRLFHDYTEETAYDMVMRQEGVRIVEMWQSDDVRGIETKWLNLLVKKDPEKEESNE
ncbi:MAG: class I SAM-dependent methyltransferase [Blautia sp.]|nr:class I SAM-dependent methyltransferase [Blautia sp.]MDY4516245.1 class I SAM-dependent methyltransferase [Lachnospiraceae bacterium]